MKTMKVVPVLLAALVMTTSLTACIQGECGASASCPAPLPLMTAEITDIDGSILVDGYLLFYQLDGSVDDIELSIVSGVAGMQIAGMTRPQAIELVAGRPLVPPPTFVRYRVGISDVLREAQTTQMTVEVDSSVTIVVQMGDWTDVTPPTEPHGPPLDLPRTATMTVHGPLRLGCSFAPSATEPGSLQLDASFTSTYCAALRAELGLDALVARSLRI